MTQTKPKLVDVGHDEHEKQLERNLPASDPHSNQGRHRKQPNDDLD